MVTGDNQIRALIRLLSDEDDRIAKTISGKLIEIGDCAIPLLTEAEIEQPEMGRRIEGILDEIRGGRLVIDGQLAPEEPPARQPAPPAE